MFHLRQQSGNTEGMADFREPPDDDLGTESRPATESLSSFTDPSTESRVSGTSDLAPDLRSSTSPDPGALFPEPSDGGDAGYATLANGVLSPKHRRLCQLSAAGSSNAKIAEELELTGNRVSILLRNPYIADEIRRLQERIFEETIKTRLKAFAEPALNNIQTILTDTSNRVKVSEKADMSKWVVEKLDGKATQTNDIGENMLSVLLDRLDARKTQPLPEPRIVGGSDIETKAIAAPEPRELTQEEIWARDFCSES